MSPMTPMPPMRPIQILITPPNHDPQNPRLTFPARPLILASMLMNALLGDIGSVVVVVNDGPAAGTCRA